MCTAITMKAKDFYFGRNLDFEHSYGEQIVVTPRNYLFTFRHTDKTLTSHYAMIGMAHPVGGYPLYYEAVNEKGLGIAGLLFSGNAHYEKPAEGKDNITSFELIPWILGQCATCKEARTLLAKIRIVDTAFSKELPPSPLHWLIADETDCITLECTKEGMAIYDNPVGVLTNNPPFPQQMFSLNQYMHLSPKQPVNHFSDKLDLTCFSRGMGALGLPGDLSSGSRFVRAAFHRMNAKTEDTEESAVGQFFHLLTSVEQQRGSCEVAPGEYEITIYSSCCNAGTGVYYYTTYTNRRITAVDMHLEDLDGDSIICYPMLEQEQIYVQNRKDS